MSYATLELQPPWASELLARNRKVARNIWSSSDISDLEVSPIEKATGVQPPWTKHSPPASVGVKSVGDSRSGCKSYNYTDESSVHNNEYIPKSKAGISHLMLTSEPIKTDKSSMTHNDNNAASSKKHQAPEQVDVATNKEQGHSDTKSKIKSRSFDDERYEYEEEESLIEYGPGIVRKLRSKYQSLAVRQSSFRPSLWRSASLENCLDLEQELSPAPPTPQTSPVINKENYKKNMTVSQQDDRSRGRQLVNQNVDSLNSDRMRRARSVDALHNIVNTAEKPSHSPSYRRDYQLNDEEILEKCKTVVTPKEEIVIIEMSKPSTISTTGATLLRLANYDKRKLQHEHQPGNANTNANSNGYYYRNNSAAKNYFATSNSTSFDLAGLVRVDSVNSPVDELPPHDIVRETARLFEIHSSNSGANWRKVVGQALRLPNNSSSNIKAPSQETEKPVISEQLTPTVVNSAPCMSGKSDDTRKGSLLNSPVPTISKTNQPKQVGVIRPTVSNGIKAQESIQCTGMNDSATTKSIVSSPGLSPIPMNLGLQKAKPPLSPKPTNLFYTSSPKTFSKNNLGFTEKNNSTIEKTVSQEYGPRLAKESMQKNSNTKNFDDLQHKNRNGNDVMHSLSTPERVVSTSTSLKVEESESKASLSNVALKPVPLVITKTSSLNNSQERENKEPLKVDNANMNNTVRSNLSTPLTENKDSSLSPRASPTREPLPFQQIKSQLKKQSHVNSSSNTIVNYREEIISIKNNSGSSNNNANGNVNLISRKCDNTIVNNNSNEKKETTTSIQKPKAKFTEVEADKKQIKATVNPPKETIPSSISNVSPTPSARPTSTPLPIPHQSSSAVPPVKPRQSKPSAQDGGAMVFNFTARNKVPDYIEDDGLVALKRGGQEDEIDSNDPAYDTDPKLIQFVGANIVINGKSSIQKKPKTQKLNISFNEGATTTFEYPSEISLLDETDGNNPDNENNNANASMSTNTASNNSILGQKTSNGIHGSAGGLGSYTPSKVSPSLYQLGSYKENIVVGSVQVKKSEPSNESTPNEDYLRPDTETTTWSNEIGAADILF